MKKVLSILGLIAIFSLTTPVLAAPHGGSEGPRGPHGGPAGHRIHAGGHHHRPPMMGHGHHHGGIMIHSGYPRHRHWNGYGIGYRGGYWCDYRLGCYNPYFMPPMNTFGLSFVF